MRLSEPFAGHGRLLAIHNMGQRCRDCTLWADGVNGFLPHLESAIVPFGMEPSRLGRLGGDNWTPQFSYWQMPRALEDSGANVLVPLQQP